MKILVDMPEGWKIDDCWSGTNCYKCERYHNAIGKYCPLANAVDAVEVHLVENDEAGAGVADKSGLFYHEEDTLYAVRKQEGR